MSHIRGRTARRAAERQTLKQNNAPTVDRVILYKCSQCNGLNEVVASQANMDAIMLFIEPNKAVWICPDCHRENDKVAETQM